MAEASLRAGRPTARGGLPNAQFVVAAAERPPAALHGIAAEVTILFPWGSLLRGALALDDARAAAAGIALLVTPGGRIGALVSIDPRDRLDIAPLTIADCERLACRWARVGLTLTGFAPAGDAVIRASGSSWARRLGAGRDRAVWAIELARPVPEAVCARGRSVPEGVLAGHR
ncbi:MAG: hypothetical protein H0V73_08365 [Chloroflexi bacterium]|nr:hypothetical protein [Chloroflexota bacterium]